MNPLIQILQGDLDCKTQELEEARQEIDELTMQLKDWQAVAADLREQLVKLAADGVINREECTKVLITYEAMKAKI